MQALLLILTLVAQTTAPLPGDGYTLSAEELVLRSGPSDNHPGVLVLPAGSVLRQAKSGTSAYQAVHIAQGFPIYLHGAFVEVDSERQTARVVGQRVNARLLPATVGLLPVGRIDSQAGDLVLLDVEGDWVRVLAPVGLVLHAARGRLQAMANAVGAPLWQQAWDTRDSGRRARVQTEQSLQADWLVQHDAELEMDLLGSVDVTLLDDDRVALREHRLADIGRNLTEASPARDRWQTLIGAVRDEHFARSQAAGARAVEQQNLAAEARALALGLSYAGRGEALRIEGLVTRLTSSESEGAVFSISDGSRDYKLSAPNGVAVLPDLEGNTVVLEGRTLQLMNVEGPVLVIDRVVNSGS
jgi:hypothetical protein